MTASPSLDELHHEYGSKATAVEPGGAEPIPLEDRHGKPSQMFWTWVSPNMEFATIFVGVIAVLFFGLTFWQAVAAIVIGNALGAISHGVLTSWGPERGRRWCSAASRSATGATCCPRGSTRSWRASAGSR